MTSRPDRLSRTRAILTIARQDLHYASRCMRRAPGFATAVVLTLGLGIGAATAMFGFLYGILFRPLPYDDAERLVVIRMERVLDGTQAPVRALFPLGSLPDLQRGTDAFEAMAFYAPSTSLVSHQGFISTVPSAAVSATFFGTVHGRLQGGRGWSSPEDAGASVVISERLQQRLFGAGTAIGLSLTIDSRPYEIVGIAGRDFQFPSRDIDIWIPATDEGTCCQYAAVARLRPGQTRARAIREVNNVIGALALGAPRVYAGATAAVLPIQDELIRDARAGLWLMMGAVGLLLAVSGANATNLLVVRNAARWRETALRVALGASRGRLWSQSFAHAVLIVGSATAVGWLVAAGIVAGLLSFDATALPRLDPTAVRLDLPVFTFAVAVASVLALVTSVVPASAPHGHLSRSVPAPGVGPGPQDRRLRDALVVVQLAASVTLLATAMTVAAGLVKLTTTDLGIRPENVAAAAMNLTHERRLSSAQQVALVDTLIERIGALPDVQAAGVGASLPPSVSNLVVTLKRSGDVVDYQAAAVPATPGYFSALGVQLIQGTLFSGDETPAHEQVMVMSAGTARRFFGDQDAVGRTLRLPVLRDGIATSAEVRLIGVIANVKYSGLQAAPEDVIFRPYRQQPWPTGFLVVNAAGDPGALLRQLRQEIAAVDPAIAVGSISTLEDTLAMEAAQPRLRRAIFSTVALLALAIASVGIYGLTAYGVTRRRQEFGVRMALGATRADIVALVFRGGFTVVASGLALGLLGAQISTRMLAAAYYGLEPNDWASVALASVVLVLVAGAATLIPASRAARVDPIVALRCE